MAGLQSGPEPVEHASTSAAVDDWQLVDLAIGNPQAFEPLFERYWDAIYRYCFYRLGNVEDAEDAAIQILSNAFGALSRLSNRGKTFRSWLFVIAHNEVASVGRLRARNPQISEDASPDRIDHGPTPEQMVLQSGEALETRALVAQLSDRPRQVVELRLAGLTDSEIAQVLGISPGAVRQAQFRAISQLREMMNVQTSKGRSTNA